MSKFIFSVSDADLAASEAFLLAYDPETLRIHIRRVVAGTGERDLVHGVENRFQGILTFAAKLGDLQKRGLVDFVCHALSPYKFVAAVEGKPEHFAFDEKRGAVILGLPEETRLTKEHREALAVKFTSALAVLRWDDKIARKTEEEQAASKEANKAKADKRKADKEGAEKKAADELALKLREAFDRGRTEAEQRFNTAQASGAISTGNAELDETIQWIIEADASTQAIIRSMLSTARINKAAA